MNATCGFPCLNIPIYSPNNTCKWYHTTTIDISCHVLWSWYTTLTQSVRQQWIFIISVAWHHTIGCDIIQSSTSLVLRPAYFGKKNSSILLLLIPWRRKESEAIALTAQDTSMGQCKKYVTPVRQQWSYVFLALTHGPAHGTLFTTTCMILLSIKWYNFTR